MDCNRGVLALFQEVRLRIWRGSYQVYAMGLFPCLNTASRPLGAVQRTLDGHLRASNGCHPHCRINPKITERLLLLLITTFIYFSDPEKTCTGVMLSVAVADCRYRNLECRRRREATRPPHSPSPLDPQRSDRV